MDPFDSAVRLAEAVRERELSPVEIADTYLERIERFDPEIGAFVWRNDEEVREAALKAERAVMEGGGLPVFHGVPIPIKDVNLVAGQPATFGSLGCDDTPRTVTDPVVTRFLDAGFLLMGRTSTPDMGMLTAAESSRYGITRNPWNTEYSPGGSSGGAAAAVAAGLAPVAHANDGGGSIRMPSSCCGLVGLKPSRGRVPQYLAAWEHAAVEGAITRTVQDAAALLDVMSVPDSLVMYGAPAPERPFSEEVGRESVPLRVGLLLEAPTGVPVDPVCVAAAERTGKLLESLGHAVFPVSPRFFSEETGLGYAQTVLDAALWTAPYDRPELAEPHLRFRMERAKTRHSGEYTRMAALLQQEAVEVRAQWGRDFDVLLTPTLACPPPPAGACLAEATADPSGFRMTENQMISFTSVCNITGLPAISLPVHTSPDGLPIGSQLIGGPWDEATLLRLASALEAPADWTVRRPPGFE
jgi:amidase